jgi:hypothetical protein
VSAVDFAYLEGFLAGDRSVVLEVLELFQAQARRWAEILDAGGGEDPRALAHTIKGAALGVGANALGAAAHEAEVGEGGGLGPLRRELAVATQAVDAYLGHDRPV